MRRILMVLTVAVLMVTMMALSAVPSFAQVGAESEQEAEADVGSLFVIAQPVGTDVGTECTGIEASCLPPITLPMSG
jgi:hypothetical protein